MPPPVRKYALTYVGLGLGLAVLLASLGFDLDVFENLVAFLESSERYEVDELLLACFIFAGFAAADQFRRRRERRIEMEKLKIYKAMLFSTHHILNNFLNQMLIVRLAAEDTPGFDPAVLAHYEQIIRDTSAQIAALGKLARVDAETILESVEPR